MFLPHRMVHNRTKVEVWLEVVPKILGTGLTPEHKLRHPEQPKMPKFFQISIRPVEVVLQLNLSAPTDPGQDRE